MLKQKEVPELKRGPNFWQQLADAADLPGEDLPGQSIVELTGDCRVLIEHHRGVSQYSREKIGVKVKCGIICISGNGLELTQMKKEHLVIRGRIESVTVHRREKA